MENECARNEFLFDRYSIGLEGKSFRRGSGEKENSQPASCRSGVFRKLVRRSVGMPQTSLGGHAGERWNGFLRFMAFLAENIVPDELDFAQAEEAMAAIALLHFIEGEEATPDEAIQR